MRTSIILLSLMLAACARQADRQATAAPTRSVAASSPAAGQSPMTGKVSAEMKMIPIPKDKAQLTRLLAMGYTVHENHMHPPGVKSCAFDKQGGSVIE